MRALPSRGNPPLRCHADPGPRRTTSSCASPAAEPDRPCARPDVHPRRRCPRADGPAAGPARPGQRDAACSSITTAASPGPTSAPPTSGGHPARSSTATRTTRSILQRSIDTWTRRAYLAQRRALAVIHRRLAVRAPEGARVARPALTPASATAGGLRSACAGSIPGRVTTRFARAHAPTARATLRLWQRRSALCRPRRLGARAGDPGSARTTRFSASTATRAPGTRTPATATTAACSSTARSRATTGPNSSTASARPTTGRSGRSSRPRSGRTSRAGASRPGRTRPASAACSDPSLRLKGGAPGADEPWNDPCRRLRRSSPDRAERVTEAAGRRTSSSRTGAWPRSSTRCSPSRAWTRCSTGSRRRSPT